LRKVLLLLILKLSHTSKQFAILNRSLIKQEDFELNPDTYTFTGDAVTFIGLIGVISSAVIIFVAYRRYWNSPFRR